MERNEFSPLNPALAKQVEQQAVAQIEAEREAEEQSFPEDIRMLLAEIRQNDEDQRQVRKEIDEFYSNIQDMDEHLFDKSDVARLQDQNILEDLQNRQVRLLKTREEISEELNDTVRSSPLEIIRKYNDYKRIYSGTNKSQFN